MLHQLGVERVVCPRPSGVPLVAPCSLVSGTAHDDCTVTFLLKMALKQELEEERKRKRKGVEDAGGRERCGSVGGSVSHQWVLPQ